MGEQGDGTLPLRRQAGTGKASQLMFEALFRMARENRDSGHEPDRDNADGSRPEVTERLRGTEPAEPPWPTVIATTVRLMLRRRLARFGEFLRRRWVIALVALAATVAAGAATVSLSRHAVTTAPAARHQAARTGVLTGPAGQSASALAASQVAAVWVAQQVSRDAIVACDPSMCALLQARGLPAGNLFVLRSGAADPVFSDVIVATQAVRNLIGSRLQAVNAPTVIASFGSGAARIDVRAVAPDGAVAYQAALSSDWAARRSAAADLVRNPRVHAVGAARRELRTGQVDSRLLITLASLAVSRSVTIVAFGDSAPGASPGVPLREMDISGTGSPADRSTELQLIRAFVLAQRPGFLPAHVRVVQPPNSGEVLRIEFGAPSPLGLLLGGPVTQ